MKKNILYLLLFLTTLQAFSQKKPSVRGSKIVTIQKKEVASFDAVQIQDGLEIILIKNDKSGVELEADDNLQDVIALKMSGNTLIISALKEFYGFKKFNIRIYYDKNLKNIIAKDKSVVNAFEEMVLDEITFKTFDQSKLFLNLNIKKFQLIANNDTRIEMNLKSENAVLQINNNSEIKALIAANALNCDLYQKANANIEGDCIDLKLRLDNNSKFIGNKLTAKNMKLVTEAYTNCTVFAENTLELEASGNSEINLFGNPKIDLKKFADNSVLIKKNLK